MLSQVLLRWMRYYWHFAKRVISASEYLWKNPFLLYDLIDFLGAWYDRNMKTKWRFNTNFCRRISSCIPYILYKIAGTKREKDRPCTEWKKKNNYSSLPVINDVVITWQVKDEALQTISRAIKEFRYFGMIRKKTICG